MANFGTEDKFSTQQNFERIRFGANVPLPEVELNELQKIQSYKRELMAKQIITNGIVTKPLAVTLSLGIFTVPPFVFCYDGDIAEVLDNMTISNCVAGEKIYLRTKEVEVAYTDTIYKSGNLSGGAVITNTLLDERVGEETSKRVQKQVSLSKTNADSSYSYLLLATVIDANNFTNEITYSKINLSVAVADIVQDSTHRFVSDTEKTLWADKYTRVEVSNLISSGISAIEWKPSVATYASLSTTYPTPSDGWIATVRATDIVYLYTGSAWIPISANSIPVVTTSVDGKMSASDKVKLDGIATGANNYTHPANHAPSIITQDANNRFVTDAEKTAWNAKANITLGTSQPASGFWLKVVG